MEKPAHGRARLFGLVSLLGVFVLLGSIASEVPASAAATTATSVLAAAKSAIAKETGVHVDFSAHSSLTSKSEHIVADVGTATGVETVVEGSSNLTVELSSTYAYVKGNASGLTTLLGLSTTQAKRIGAKWAYWKAGSSVYANLKHDVTIAAVGALLPSPNGTKLSTHVTNGVTQDIVTWSTPASSASPKISNTLVFSTGSSILPVRETSSTQGNTSVTTKLSRWGERVSFTAPARTSTIAG
jgi:hypothetical protein